MSESSDFELLAQWRDGDKTAGNRLVRRHHASVYRFFRSKVDSGVDDLTQQTFLAVVENRDQFRLAGTFKAYVFGIARRQLMLALRSRYRSAKVFAPDEVSVGEIGDSDGASPSQVVAQTHQQQLLLTALRNIPVDFQIVVELHYWEGMGVAEIARVIEVAPGTVKSRLSRARAMLQRSIDKLATQRGLVRLAGGEVDALVTSLQGILVGGRLPGDSE